MPTNESVEHWFGLVCHKCSNFILAIRNETGVTTGPVPVQGKGQIEIECPKCKHAGRYRPDELRHMQAHTKH